MMEQQLLMDAYRQLFIALKNGGLAQIAQTAYELLRKPVIIVNAELKKLAQYPEIPLDDPIWDAYFDHRTMTPEMIWQLIGDSTIRQSENSDVPVWIDWGLVEKLPRLVGNVRINGVVEGFVGVLFADKTHTEADVQITELICQSVALEIGKKNLPASSRHAMITSIISDLFQGKTLSGEELTAWEKSIGLKLAPHFCVAVSVGREQEKAALYHLRDAIEGCGGNIYASVLDHQLNILLSDASGQPGCQPEGEKRLGKIAEMTSRHGLVMGVSNLFDDLSEMENFRYQAGQAVQVGRESSPGQGVYFFQELIMENMMSIVRENIKPQNYLHPSLAVLQQHDSSSGTEYLTTLREFITTMCSHAKTAEKLHIHRNTLLYRLNRIGEIAALDLADERLCALLLCDFYLIEEGASR